MSDRRTRGLPLLVGFVLCALTIAGCGGEHSDAGPEEPRTSSAPAVGESGGLDPSSPLGGVSHSGFLAKFPGNPKFQREFLN